MSGMPFTYISYGAGVQSTALLVMSALQLDRYPCPKADVAIFADTGGEPQWVYDTLGYYDGHFSSKIPLIVVRKKRSLTRSLLDIAHKSDKRFASIPAFTANPNGEVGLTRRQCTREYKIEVIEKSLRRALKKLHRPKSAVALIGISLDEVDRMKPNRTKWIENQWPLIDNRMTREDCKHFLAALDLPVPRKSSCVFCPFHSDAYWLDLKRNFPREFTRAVKIDRAIRVQNYRGMTSPTFLHRSLVPLSEVKFKHENQSEMFANECEGVCGV